jgi:uncharacterized membrane protein YfhO
MLPHQLNSEAQEFILDVKMPAYISDVWRNEHDRLGFTFKAPDDGQMTIHFPYDPKWRLTVDGRNQELTCVGTYFMGTNLSKGEHRLLMEYWPQTPLRWLLVLAMLLMVIALEGLIIYAFRRQKQLEGGLA